MSHLPISELPKLLASVRVSVESDSDLQHKILYQIPEPNNALENLLGLELALKFEDGLQNLALVDKCIADWRLGHPNEAERRMLNELATHSATLRPHLEAGLLAAEWRAHRNGTSPSDPSPTCRS